MLPTCVLGAFIAYRPAILATIALQTIMPGRLTNIAIGLGGILATLNMRSVLLFGTIGMVTER